MEKKKSMLLITPDEQWNSIAHKRHEAAEEGLQQARYGFGAVKSPQYQHGLKRKYYN